MKTLFIQCGESNIAFYWFIFYGNQIPAAEIANTFSTLSATGIAAFPGASSGGAGASAGAAGGGAAGGAG